jgi:hypothetical protein
VLSEPNDSVSGVNKKRTLSPLDGETRALFTQLAVGQCYKLLMYTVTESGIVSANRTELMIRTRAPLAATQLQKSNQTVAEVSTHIEIVYSWGMFAD